MMLESDTKTDVAKTDGGGFAGYGEPAVVTVLTVDDVEYSILADPTMAALKAIREIAEHVRPRRGCQEGICGKCESKVNGQDTRLCITPIGTLMDAVVVTPPPRKSIWG
jgi:aerobic-type carbon monoxide dehydrogenase small subunit (CoxS/CutS family)